ncbi:hydrogenase 2 large subunit [Adlercreutzia equolifaciens subsp. celatus]|uniref:Nickel-dependent hydrogenase large subunit n=2 Tax=Adlercreutzia equolifaciens TaxID=446660 RepID=A0A3N0AVE4_9ACTN|nr:nickel-dependent hydrogenase large subunit [Adlercreutzia equolifaciens]MCP2077878.1 hydrogenase large subunit [Adlercreutzia equolifaciens subsp. celatus DSM 18785]RFT91105.1 nickel-dependent hydrogenase large subunit [Adlercreutzia equolifaciens subsp. celatus]RNL38499.1 nickel-dependent hydrogenase large subunit [Adlercreutzia equolifaciens subsp. celatus DSM 18785]BCS57401.1 hydrogenase 2 large subunit [Adlercreutzia equolifaciens subsp. celatus]
MTRSVIDPITRIEGHLRVEMEVENGVVADAWVSGGCFRGMELVVQNRTPEDAAQIVERICGVCPVSHAHASSIAGDKAYGITISNNARIVRNLLEGAQFLHSHILWLYNLAALDYVNPLNALQANVDDAYAVALENGLALHSDLNQLYEKLAAFADNGQLSIFSGNWFDADGGEAYVDNPEANLILTSHYLEALKMQARSSEMAALLGGKMPHVMTSIPGGNMWVPTESKLDDLLAMATEVRDWVNDTVLADTVMLAKLYPEVLTFGKGCGRYIAWGVFEGPDWPYGDNYTEQMLNRYLPMAVLDEQFQASDVQENLITEYMGRSWYKGSETYTSPYFTTDPDYTDYNVDDRYTWVKCPTYDGKPMEAGSMSRIFAAYVRGVPFIKEQVDAVLGILGAKPGDLAAFQSTLGRTAIRQIETIYIANLMVEWVNELAEAIKGGDSEYFREPARLTGEGTGFWEAPRGALYHSEKVVDGKIEGYQIIIPSTWNLAPINGDGEHGPLEQALIGVPVADIEKPINALRTVHSFDPCTACAVHVTERGTGKHFETVTSPWGVK